MDYGVYMNSDQTGKQWIVRKLIEENAYLKRQIDFLVKENEKLKTRPNHLKLIEYRSRHPPQNLHIKSGEMTENP